MRVSLVALCLVGCLAAIGCEGACADRLSETGDSGSETSDTGESTEAVDFEGEGTQIDPPDSVVPGETESENIMLFKERIGYELSGSLPLEAHEPGRYESTSSLSDRTLSTGRRVDTFYVHIDHPFSDRTPKKATVTFNRQITGVVITSERMVQANSALDVSSLSTEYPTSEGAQFGLELDDEPDLFELGEDGRTLVLDVSTANKSDSMRVVFAR